jgi:hypothetical protein
MKHLSRGNLLVPVLLTLLVIMATLATLWLYNPPRNWSTPHVELSR